MFKYVMKRLSMLVVTLFLVISATFFLMKLMPGSPFANADKLSPDQQVALAAQYGLNDPLWMQYGNYVWRALHFDFGESFQFPGQTVSQLIGMRLGPSVQIGLQALIFGVTLGVVFGIFAMMHHHRRGDKVVSFISMVGMSVPSFVVAALLQYFVGLKLGWLPIAGWEGFKFTILPTLALTIAPFALSTRFMRAKLIDVMQTDYVAFARAKGLTPREIVKKHMLRNALLPLVTICGPLAVGLMTGSVVIEQVFAIPGIGNQFVSAILTNDYPMIMGTTIVYASLLMMVLLITDIIYGWLDPRIRFDR